MVDVQPKKGLQLDLNPGLRERLILQMDEAGIPEEGRLSYLSAMTGCAPQTAKRWITDEKPGLPDLKSFALLCLRFDTDANWFLGLSNVKYSLPRSDEVSEKQGEEFEWIENISQQVSEKAKGCQVFHMSGDEMEPRLPKGSPVLVNTAISKVEGNGIYAFKYQGRITVRMVENRIGEGFVLSCANQKYKDTILKDEQAAKDLGLSVIGKVECWIQLNFA